MTAARPQALLFDMDGLLLDTERVAQEVFVAHTAPHGIPRDRAEAFFVGLVGTSSAETRRQVQGFLPGIDIDGFDRAWSQDYRARLSQGVPVKPGIRAALAALSAAGHRMAVVTSSGSAHARENLTSAGLWGHFEHLTGADDVTAHKPDPLPYRHSAARMGVAPEGCVAFEDSDRGLTAAVRAGCRAVQIPDLRPPGVPLPDLGQIVAADMAEALRRLGLV